MMKAVAPKPQGVQSGQDLNFLNWERPEVLLTDDVLRVEVAMDSGAIAHVTPPGCVPAGAKLDAMGAQNFTAANGGSIKNYGETRLSLEDRMKNQMECDYNVADVTRTLHSTGQVCDHDFEVLYTKLGCAVVPEGILSQYLQEQDVVAKYPRKGGGLYVAEFLVTAPKPKDMADGIEAGFARRGVDA